MSVYLQVRVHDMHLNTTFLLSNPPPLPPPPPHKKGRIVPLQINDRYHLKVPISSPEAVLLPNQVDLEFKDSRDS